MGHDDDMVARVTLQTVADRVGVSRTTVSNAYNRPDQLGDELRDLILGAAKELGYRGPDAAGRMLRTGRMGAIGLLFTEDLRFVFTDPDTTQFMQGVAETSALAGTGLTLLPVPLGVDVSETAVPYVAVDGYLVFSVPSDHPALETVLRQGKPIVVVDEPDLESATSFVGIDDRAGARLAAGHLLALGHRKIGILFGRLSLDQNPGQRSSSDVRDASVRVARDRMCGYEDALLESGIDSDAIIIWEGGGNDPDSGRHAALDMLEKHPELTALLCFSDQLAIGAAQAGLRLGRRLPDELSIVGFDDIPRAATWDPPLTTVRQPLIDKGRVAAELLMEQIEVGGTRRIELPIELVVRASTARLSDVQRSASG
ncbi:MAG: DNA-binding LacI/PurR family transcriptional regulator [Paracrocinitomix sp.]|jgi:DNA-binding LacI/PurR family transcriptional regulator